MVKKFSIKFSAFDKDKLPLSNKINKYFEDFVIDEILKEKKIIVNTMKNIMVVMLLQKYETNEYENKVLDILKPVHLSEENLRKYYYILPLNSIMDSALPIARLVELVCDALTIFLLENYKRIDAAFLSSVWKRLDNKYLLSIPYPANRSEQRDVYSMYGY